MVLIPILQKKMIELMTNSQLEISYICIYFFMRAGGSSRGHCRICSVEPSGTDTSENASGGTY